MKSKFLHAVVSVVLALTATVLHAHPGHAAGDWRTMLADPFSGPDHFIGWAALAIWAGLLLRRARHIKTPAAYGWAGAGIAVGVVLVSLT